MVYDLILIQGWSSTWAGVRRVEGFLSSSPSTICCAADEMDIHLVSILGSILR